MLRRELRDKSQREIQFIEEFDGVRRWMDGWSFVLDSISSVGNVMGEGKRHTCGIMKFARPIEREKKNKINEKNM
jgi:hypothetical protein